MYQALIERARAIAQLSRTATRISERTDARPSWRWHQLPRVLGGPQQGALVQDPSGTLCRVDPAKDPAFVGYAAHIAHHDPATTQEIAEVLDALADALEAGLDEMPEHCVECRAVIDDAMKPRAVAVFAEGYSEPHRFRATDDEVDMKVHDALDGRR